MSTVKVTIIGCGDAFGSGGRFNTCFCVETLNTKFLIDCGATSLVGLNKLGINPLAIDAVLITHFHGDHYGGIPFLLMDAATKKRQTTLTIITPPGGKQRIAALLASLYPGSDPLAKLSVYFIEYHDEFQLDTAYFNLIAYPVIHSEAALPHGLRIFVEDKIIAYSGDTVWVDNLIPLSKDADLFICECNFYRTEVNVHMNYQDIKKHREELTCKRLLLTHFDNEMLERLDEVAFECAHDGLKIEI